MADVTYSASLKVDKDYLNTSVQAASITATMAIAGMSSLTMTLGTAATSVVTANLTTVGLAFFRNVSTSTASSAIVGISAGGSNVGFCSLRAGEPAVVRLTSGTQYSAWGVAGTRLRIDITEG